MLHSRVTPRKWLLWIGLRENWWVLFCIRTWIDRKEQWINYKPICKKSQERADGILPLWMCPKSEEIMFSTQEPEKVNRAQRRKKNSMRSHFLKHSVCNIAPIKNHQMPYAVNNKPTPRFFNKLAGHQAIRRPSLSRNKLSATNQSNFS